MLKPIEKMIERVSMAREESDTALFHCLLYYGEMITKLVASGMVAAIDDDRNRTRYSMLYRLFRADGIGEWSSVLEEILFGPTSRNIREAARKEHLELTQKCDRTAWQYKAVHLIYENIKCINPQAEKLSTKVDARQWFTYFAELRNYTRGHGAPTGEFCSKNCESLEKSISILVNNLSIFKRPWAYLHRNLSGRYRVVKWVDEIKSFDHLKSETSVNYADGAYIYFDSVNRVELIESDVEASDFFFPNGKFNDRNYEMLSYISGDRLEGDSSLYLAPATDLPVSETQGLGTLSIQGKSYGNLPPSPAHYICRSGLEEDLSHALMDEQHSIITLSGRGGIGKTWLALSVLHKIANEGKYTAIIWFSARDIDLLSHGPKVVKPHILTEKDVANEFAQLIPPMDMKMDEPDPVCYLSKVMAKSSEGPILFVFDNFETVRRPAEMFKFIDTYIRVPNKALITTRVREFKGDYWFEVGGMSDEESELLIETTSKSLGILDLLTDDYKRELIQESSGHPYVIKVLLGEVAKAGRVGKVGRIVASIDNIIVALFERTYNSLTPAAKRVFLTLCNWRSAIPQVALEAVLLRPANERIEIESAIDELERSSLIEIDISQKDQEPFISVPLVASEFGRKKLLVSAMKTAIEIDCQYLYAFGAIQQADVSRGIGPRIERLFKYSAARLSSGQDTLENCVPVLEFVARKYPEAWLWLADLYSEFGGAKKLVLVNESLVHYLESVSRDKQNYSVWVRLSKVCIERGDALGEAAALVEACQLPSIPFYIISDSAKRLSALFWYEKLLLGDADEKRAMIQKLVKIMKARIEEGDATDCSRLAWLCLHLNDEVMARQLTIRGLQRDPRNEHCLKLASKFSIKV